MCWLRITTPTFGWVRRRSAAKRMPSSVRVGGIRMSVSTTSGSAVSTDALRESRSSFAATSSMPSIRSSAREIPSRTRKLSSPTTTRIVISELQGPVEHTFLTPIIPAGASSVQRLSELATHPCRQAESRDRCLHRSWAVHTPHTFSEFPVQRADSVREDRSPVLAQTAGVAMNEIRRSPARRAGARAVLVEPTADELPFDVVESKLRPPAAVPGAVSRTALVNRLRADLSSRAISIVAPAGYGKTTLLAQWSARDGRRFAWLALDQRDNDPVALLRHLAAALAGVTAVDARALNALASAKPPVWDAIVPRLVSAFAAVEACVLVVEDAHVLHEPDSIEIVSMLAEHVPSGSAIAISTRTECPVATRLRMRGTVVELGTQDLALTRREAELLLRAAGVELSGEACDDLLDRTEGWAGALQLAALATRRHGAARLDADEVPFGGDHRFVTTYVEAEYLSRLSDDQRAFLRRTSLLERMSGPVCDAVLGRKHSATELETIRSANLFLVPLDAHGEWYRYHHLFRELLRRELSEDDADLVPELGRRAADWFEQHDDPEAALDYALLAADTDRAASLL